jgi:hypothetical protein
MSDGGPVLLYPEFIDGGSGVVGLSWLGADEWRHPHIVYFLEHNYVRSSEH